MFRARSSKDSEQSDFLLKILVKLLLFDNHLVYLSRNLTGFRRIGQSTFFSFPKPNDSISPITQILSPPPTLVLPMIGFIRAIRIGTSDSFFPRWLARQPVRSIEARIVVLLPI